MILDASGSVDGSYNGKVVIRSYINNVQKNQTVLNILEFIRDGTNLIIQ